MDEKSISQRIQEARAHSSLTAEQLAQLVGVKPETVRRWETGLAVPRANKLVMLAGVMSVPATWLLSGDQTTNSSENMALEMVQLRNQLQLISKEHARLSTVIESISQRLSAAEAELKQE